jgi:hypothetical protein
MECFKCKNEIKINSIYLTNENITLCEKCYQWIKATKNDDDTFKNKIERMLIDEAKSY